MVDFPTYERALRSFVGLTSAGSLVRIGWETTHVMPVEAHTAGGFTPASPQGSVAPASHVVPTAQAYGGMATERTINIQIENVLLDRTAFEVGEQIFLSATVSRTSFLQCYLAEAKGTVIRLLPNLANPTGWVSANQAIRIPDWMSPNPGFIMDAANPGIEGVACFATDEESVTKLPEDLRVPPLKPIKGYATLDQINDAFAGALGKGSYTGNAVYWQVVPRRAVPLAPAAPVGRK